MTIKIQCPCGVKYALEISAEHLNNPIRFVCNQCGADSSAAINQIVRQQFEGSEQPAESMRGQPVRVPMAEVASPICHRHSDQPAMTECLVCKKPICPECMKLFGYVCSAYCAGQAERAGVQLPVFEGQRDVVEARFWKKVRRVVACVLVVLALLVAGAAWYNFFGSRPKAAYAVKFSEKRNDGFCRFISQDQVLVQHGNKLARYDVKQKREVWSIPLVDPEHIKESAAAWVDADQFADENRKLRLARLKAEGKRREAELEALFMEREAPKSEAHKLAEAAKMIEEELLRQVQFHVEDTDIWLAFTNKLAHVDWTSGAMDKEIPLDGQFQRFIAREGALLAVCDRGLGERALTHVRLPGGEAQTEMLKPELVRGTNNNRILLPDIDIPVTAMTIHIRPNAMDGPEERFMESAVGTYIVNAGTNVAEMRVAMVQENITQHRSMKERTGKSVLESDLNASKTAEVANEILNEFQEQRTGGVRFEDESRYLVTIRRKLANGSVPDWTGEVVGPPQLLTLNTVDVLTAGKTMMVIDKHNQKRWETKLAYPALRGWMLGGQVPWRNGEADLLMPCVERGNTLYFFDQGVLAAFDIITGNARWRLPTVGASNIKFDDQGMMYVITSSAQQDQIKYSDQIDVTRKNVPMVMKVDPANGTVLWSLRQTGQTCLFSGKFFYAAEAHGGRFGKDVPAHTRIYRLHPRDGRVIWDHIEQQYPVDLDFRDNKIVALFPDEMKVLQFLSL